jgi:hypothetical protein
MKKLIIVAALAVACVLTAAPRASAQSAFFQYGNVPVGGLTVMPGQSFTLQLNIVFNSGGSIQNLGGVSYWIFQSAGTGFPLTLTNRDFTGSIFNAAQSNVSYPQILDPINRNSNGTTTNTDLGALYDLMNAPQPSGTYFIANLTFMVGNGATPGSYTISNTTQSTPGVGGRFSVITDDEGDTFNINASPFTFTVVQSRAPSLSSVSASFPRAPQHIAVAALRRRNT